MSTPPRSTTEPVLPSTLPRPDAVEVVSAPPSPVQMRSSAAAAAAGAGPMLQPVNLFPAAAAVPKKWTPYTGDPVESVFVGQMSVYSALKGDIEPMPVATERAALALPVKPSEPRTNDDSIYGVAPAADVLASLSAAPAAAPPGGRRARTGRRRLLSGPRRTARRRAFSRNRRYTRPQLI